MKSLDSSAAFSSDSSSVRSATSAPHSRVTEGTTVLRRELQRRVKDPTELTVLFNTSEFAIGALFLSRLVSFRVFAIWVSSRVREADIRLRSLVIDSGAPEVPVWQQYQPRRRLRRRSRPVRTIGSSTAALLS